MQALSLMKGLRPNRFTGRSSSSTAPPERSDGAPSERSTGAGKGIEPKPRLPGVQRPETPEVPEEPTRSSQPKQGPKGRWNNQPMVFPHNIAGAGSTYSGDLVRIDNLPLVNVWDPSETRIWGALDGGCNSTCHSTAWKVGREASQSFGLEFPLG